MQETPSQYTRRLLGYQEGKKPASVTECMRNGGKRL